MGKLLLSMRLAVLTVSPRKQYRGHFMPITPAYAPPQCTPVHPARAQHRPEIRLGNVIIHNNTNNNNDDDDDDDGDEDDDDADDNDDGNSCT